MSAEILNRALGYPYETPVGSYIFDPATGTARKWDHSAITHDATPVLALGSNAAPAQLARKFADDIAPIPVAQAYLADFDIVYAAQLTTYGSIPATLAPMPGAVARLHVTYLTPAQLSIMHKTEAAGERYDYLALTGLKLKIADGVQINRAHCYVARAGAIHQNETLLGLADRKTTKSSARRLTQEDVQNHCRSLLGDMIGNEASLEEFILSNVANPNVRSRRTAALGPFATRFDFT